MVPYSSVRIIFPSLSPTSKLKLVYEEGKASS